MILARSDKYHAFVLLASPFCFEVHRVHGLMKDTDNLIRILVSGLADVHFVGQQVTARFRKNARVEDSNQTHETPADRRPSPCAS